MENWHKCFVFNRRQTTERKRDATARGRCVPVRVTHGRGRAVVKEYSTGVRGKLVAKLVAGPWSLVGGWSGAEALW